MSTTLSRLFPDYYSAQAWLSAKLLEAARLGITQQNHTITTGCVYQPHLQQWGAWIRIDE